MDCPQTCNEACKVANGASPYLVDCRTRSDGQDECFIADGGG
jgi:hypothetical protein